MSSKAIREYDGKRILQAALKSSVGHFSDGKIVQIRFDEPVDTEGIQSVATLNAYSLPNSPLPLDPSASFESIDKFPESITQKLLDAKLNEALSVNSWLLSEKLVVKPDQLIKRRGKSGLIALNVNWEEAKKWICDHAMKKVKIDQVEGTLKVFLVEPYITHSRETEHYLCIQSVREGDEILFYEKGGVDVGDIDTLAKRLLVPIDSIPCREKLSKLISGVDPSKFDSLITFIQELFNAYVDLQFTYVEINPIVLLHDKVYCLDLAGKLDQTAEYECANKWKPMKMENGSRVFTSIEFPSPFGRELTKEEAYIAELDSKTGASLKLTILNKDGRIWTMVAGGGASVVYSDAIASLGFAHELANYGEYSGAPSENQTFEYAKTILDLMTRGELRPDGKILLIGGGIANFTNVASTFKGIIRSIHDYQHRLLSHRVKIYVRRAGPNYQEGLRMMQETGDALELPIYVFGPETHMTAIVSMALKCNTNGYLDDSMKTRQFCDHASLSGSPYLGASSPSLAPAAISDISSLMGKSTITAVSANSGVLGNKSRSVASTTYLKDPSDLFTHETTSFVYGMQPKAVQGMLDFDFMCKRTKPSVAAMIYPFGGNHVQKFYWGATEILIPVYTSVNEALKRHSDADTVINFASYRSVYESVLEVLNSDTNGQIRTMAIIAEGVPERRAKQLISIAQRHKNKSAAQGHSEGLTLIGPATVGGIKAGCFKIGNTGGMIDNLLSSKLYRPGSVAYVSKSGGMSNELNNIISRTTNGVFEGVAIGGDRYPGTTFIDHCLRFEKNPNCKMMLILGEVGGIEEYKVAKAIKEKLITKPLIAWCIGTCASLFQTDVQFGHAGACATSSLETSEAKNKAMKEAGALVPRSFDDIPSLLSETYQNLVADGQIVPEQEPEPPKVPIDYSWAQELGLVRKPANFVSTICDDRGQELLYAGMPISSVFKENIGIGGVLSLLWFRRRLPDYAHHFIEMVLMLTADHGPAVSGAHNTIVTTRAGKDLVSSLATGILTIGDRFGGALDAAAEQFSAAHDQGLSPHDFVENMRKQHKHIMGIGHKVKSRTNPDHRVTIIKEYAKKCFLCTSVLDYALRVEEITTAKKENLILNVDGVIGVLFVDLLRHCGAFNVEEADEYIKIGTLNGLFVLGRSIGFIGHYLDQKRLKQGLYRHPWDDISYLMSNPAQPAPSPGSINRE